MGWLIWATAIYVSDRGVHYHMSPHWAENIFALLYKDSVKVILCVSHVTLPCVTRLHCECSLPWIMGMVPMIHTISYWSTWTMALWSGHTLPNTMMDVHGVSKQETLKYVSIERMQLRVLDNSQRMWQPPFISYRVSVSMLQTLCYVYMSLNYTLRNVLIFNKVGWH